MRVGPACFAERIRFSEMISFTLDTEVGEYTVSRTGGKGIVPDTI